MTAQDRKQRPLYSGVLRYFPDALLEVARCSYLGNEQHNPGQPLHWDRSKSTDDADALMRHLLDAGTVDSDGVRHTAKVAWRALALLQKELEAAAERVGDDDKRVSRQGDAQRCADGPHHQPERGEQQQLVDVAHGEHTTTPTGSKPCA